MNILLLNSTVPTDEVLFVRHLNCSQVSKARAIEPPVDLIILSGILAQDRHKLSYIDGAFPNVTDEFCLSYIRENEIEAVFLLMGEVTKNHDIAFARKIRAAFPALVLVGLGDFVRLEPSNTLQKVPELTGLLLDFTTQNTLRFLRGERNLVNIISREDSGASNLLPVHEKDFNIGTPRHELYGSLPYRSALAMHRRQAVTMFSFGCPYVCTFCPYEKDKYKLRDFDSARKELLHIKQSGFRDIHFMDPTFAYKRKWGLELLEFMAMDIQLPWWCHTRADVLDATMVEAFRKAGCHTLTIGVETITPEVSKAIKKEAKVEEIRSAFELCKKANIRVLAHFILGLPGETYETNMQSINFAVETNPFYASFNIIRAMPGTALGDSYIRIHGRDEKQLPEQSYAFPEQSSAQNVYDVARLRDYANRRFYLRPSKVLQMATAIRTWYDFERMVVNGLDIVRRYGSKSKRYEEFTY